MSGYNNPFRRSRVIEADPASANIFDQVGKEFAQASDDADSSSSSKASKKPKRVKIQTPPLSPQSPDVIYSPGNGGSTPSAADPTSRALSPTPSVTPAASQRGEEQATGNTSGSTAPVMRPAPYNPFTRTLATQDAGFGRWKESGDTERETPEQRPKAGLDVDVFKNILMTGAPVPTLGGASSRPQDSNSSTDTSFVFDLPSTIQPPSPTHTLADYESESASEEEVGDNERLGLMGAGRSDDLAPPAPPKPKSRGPQTVSFADFDQSIPTTFAASGPRTPPIRSQHLAGILRAPSPRLGSDLNKPLPPPPPPHTSDTANSTPPSVPDKDTPPRPTYDEASGSKKAPPPPPASRKAGVHGRARSISNTSSLNHESIHSTLDTPGSGSPAFPNKLAPPPPPSRKPHPINSATTDASPKPYSPNPLESKAVPVPPPRRHGSKSDRMSMNSSRQVSDDSSKKLEASAPPPPPPRRGHGSKRTSLEVTHRMSGEHHRAASFDSERSASFSSLHKVVESEKRAEHCVGTPPTEPAKDILADMAAFQAEIDAMRAQSGDAR